MSSHHPTPDPRSATDPAPSLSPAAERVVAAAAEAAVPYARLSAEQRAAALRAAADAMDAAADQLIPLAESETHLPTGRLSSELGRTTFQARLFADRLEQGTLFDVRVDPADPDWGMGPRPDLRRGYVPIGVVLVFAAANFPFAFSVFGGDTVSALAAGCPVVVKAHPGHPDLSRAVAEVLAPALTDSGAPPGVLGLIDGLDDGAAAVTDPRIAAVGFTGSLAGGRALYRLAVSRPDPIPFYGELGSTNPVFITPQAWQQRGAEIAAGLAESFTLGAGQFCTNPGVVIAPDAEALIGALPPLTGARMLTPALANGFRDSVAALSATPGVTVAVGAPEATADSAGGVDGAGSESGAGSEDGADAPRPVVLRVDAVDALADPSILAQECFGPATLVVAYTDPAQALRLAHVVTGSLTATVQGAGPDDPLAAELVPLLAASAGRVLWNQWPTGVSVTDAQQHGGPFPATTAPTTTSVGTAAAQRFARPVAYQNLPAELLPPELRD